MKRVYKSGAEKRKIQGQKKKDDEEFLSKFAKLNDLFETPNAENNENSSNLPVADTSTENTNSSFNAQLAAENTSNSPDVDSTIENVDHFNESEPFTDDTPTISSEIESAPPSGIGECSTSMENLAIASNIYSIDPGLWPLFSNQSTQSNQSNQSILQRHWIKKGASACRNADSIDTPGKSGRRFTEFHFTRVLPNGKKIERDWLIYSPSAEAAFCFVCRLFGELHEKASPFALAGFKDYKHASRSYSTHEESKEHIENNVKYNLRIKHESSLADAFVNTTENEMTYWKNVLLRIVEVIKFLSSRGLAFRGSDEILGSNHNGNFLGALELLAKFDPFLKEHIDRFGNKGKGRASYLSSTKCDEFIAIMGQELKRRIAADVIDAVYYSISVDSTPDVSHSDQLAFCIRYVKDGKINERFIAFIPIEGHTAQYLFGVVSNFLEENKIDIKNCRGQSYDNANNMAGISGGLQSLIREKSESAFFVPCSAHSLNLVGVNTVSRNAIAANFFDLIESVYSFFVHSPYRWNKLKDQLTAKGEYMLKKASGTRWAARHDSVNALHSCYLKVLTVLKSFTTEKSFTEENKAFAKGLIAKLCQFQNIFALVLWKSVLSKFNLVNKVLQQENLTISVTKKLYDSLVTDLEDKSFENIFNEALKMFRSIPSDITVDIMQTRLMSHALNPENEFLPFCTWFRDSIYQK